MSLSLGMQWGKARRIEALESIYHEHPESGGAGEVLPVMLCPLVIKGDATDETNAQIAVTPSCSVTCLTSACAAPVHDVPGLRGAGP
jgi:hypothetical protein